MTHPVQLPARGWYPDPAGAPQRLRFWSGRYWGDTTWSPSERLATHRLPKRVRVGFRRRTAPPPATPTVTLDDIKAEARAHPSGELSRPRS